MKQRPDAAGLIEAARRTLLDEVVPQLSGGAKYAALMAASALATAGRDLGAGATPVADELELFRDLYGEDEVAAAGDDPEAALLALNRRLAAELRAGKWDDMPEAVAALLAGQVRLRLARTNPQHLTKVDAG